MYFLIPFGIWIIAGIPLIDPKSQQAYFSLINTHYSSFTDAFMYYATWFGEGWTIAIIFLTLLAISKFRNWWFFLTVLACNAIPNLITQWVKNIFDAPRPLKAFGQSDWIHTLPDWPRLFSRSFPSGHSTGAFCMFCLLSMFLPPRYKPIGILFFFFALLVGYSRIYLAAHFSEDVYVGSVIGGVGAVLIFAVMKRYQNYFFRKKESLQQKAV